MRECSSCAPFYLSWCQPWHSRTCGFLVFIFVSKRYSNFESLWHEPLNVFSFDRVPQLGEVTWRLAHSVGRLNPLVARARNVHGSGTCQWKLFLKKRSWLLCSVAIGAAQPLTADSKKTFWLVNSHWTIVSGNVECFFDWKKILRLRGCNCESLSVFFLLFMSKL